jgi:hypothetical protein
LRDRRDFFDSDDGRDQCSQKKQPIWTWKRLATQEHLADGRHLPKV